MLLWKPWNVGFSAFLFCIFNLICFSWLYVSGYNTGGFNGANMHGVLAGARGPFTPSQWMELEHQALIYKYITANVPIPSNLLIPIRKALDSADFSSFSGGLLRPNTCKFCLFLEKQEKRIFPLLKCPYNFHVWCKSCSKQLSFSERKGGTN